MNFLILIKPSFYLAKYITPKLNCSEFLVRIIWLCFLRVLEMLVLFKSLFIHPVLEWGLFGEHSNLSFVLWPCGFFYLLFLNWFRLSNWDLLSSYDIFGLLFLLLLNKLIFRKVFLFLCFIIDLFRLNYFRLFYKWLKLLLVEFEIHLAFTNWINEQLFNIFHIKINFPSKKFLTLKLY